MENNYYLAVLMTVFNRKEKTLSCLKRLSTQSIPANIKIDIYITNDGCTDGTPEALKILYPQIKIIDGNGTLYWNRGMLAAWKKAYKTKDYDFYLWLNDDTFLYDNAISTLINASQITEYKSLIVGTTSSTSDSNKITYGGKYNNKMIKPNGHLQECNWINGNIVLIPKYVFHIVGMNDPIYHHSLGDNDYGFRVIENGLKNYVAPAIIGTCDRHSNIEKWKDPSLPLAKRWKAMREPTGICPEEFFIYEKRHKGLINACFHYITIHIHCILPCIWNFKSNN